MLLTQGYRYNGVHANINVWNPYVEADDEYTSAQIWVVNGPYYSQDTIQTGWTVSNLTSLYDHKIICREALVIMVWLWCPPT